jgi:hypothetical protein
MNADRRTSLGATGRPRLGTHMNTEPEPQGSHVRKSGDGGRVLEFKRKLSATKRVAPITDPVRHFEAEEDRRRMQQNLAAALIIVFLIASGIWLIDHLRVSARIAACVEAGHHNCVPLDLERAPGR